jgi:hypothetical protein
MIAPRAGRPAFTILELLTTIALLVVVMGLMVSLARFVRTSSAEQLTRTLLIQMDQALAEYAARHGGAIPPVPALPSNVDEAQLAEALQQSNQQLVRTLRQSQMEASAAPGGQVTGETGRLPEVLAGELVIRDAWGQSIGYLPQQHPQIGMAPQNRPFLFSAGPDGRYLTRQDNLYSYEQSRLDQLPGVPPPLDKANNAHGGG